MIDGKFIAWAALALLAAPAQATMATIDFAGDFTVAHAGTLTGAISGHIHFDTDDGVTNSTTHPDAVTGFDISSPIFTTLFGMETVTDQSFAGSTVSIRYAPDAGQGFDEFQVDMGINSPLFTGVSFFGFYPLGSFPSSNLPTSLPPYSDLVIRGIVLTDSLGDYSGGPLTALSIGADQPSPTPEPAGWAMMVGGFGLIGGALRRRTATVAFT